MTDKQPETLMQAIRYFSDADVCREYVAAIRWPNGVACPTCGSVEVRFIATRGLWECKSKHPRKQFSVKVGTIFEDSPVALDKWLAALWMLVNDKNGISSYELHRSIGVTQATAWFMLQRLRLALEDGTFNKMNGEVEADETFIGGKARNMHKAKRAVKITGTGGKDKVAVMGLLQRKGPDGHSVVRAQIVNNTRRSSLGPVIRVNVETGAVLYSDGKRSYDGLDDAYAHAAVNHDAQEYVDGEVHTNSIENFWALLKRSLAGTYVSVEPFHLFRYLDEQVFRFNSRELSDGARFHAAMKGIIGKRLTYAQLTSVGSQSPA
jgi:transposase-like protein